VHLHQPVNQDAAHLLIDLALQQMNMTAAGVNTNACTCFTAAIVLAAGKEAVGSTAAVHVTAVLLLLAVHTCVCM
jgi:hypothetical protein